MIVVVDYGMGNVGSVLNMLKHIGVKAIATRDIEVLKQADKIILPGVGSFDLGVSKLMEQGIFEILIEHAKKNKPLLGICLGMQLLGRKSEEGKLQGLSVIPFDNKKFDFKKNSDLKIPHMGWNIVDLIQTDDPLVQDLNDSQRYYFVHSYHAMCDKNENVLIKCDYGYEFAAAVKKGNIYGVQFHPEKSHKFGMALLENFARRI